MLGEKTSLMVMVNQQLEKSWSKTALHLRGDGSGWGCLNILKSTGFQYNYKVFRLSYVVLKSLLGGQGFEINRKVKLIFEAWFLKLILPHLCGFLKSYTSIRITMWCKIILETDSHTMSREKYEMQVLWGRPASTVFLWTQRLSSSAGKGRTSNKFLDPQLHKHPEAFTSDALGWGKVSHVSQIRTWVEFLSGKAPCGLH